MELTSEQAHHLGGAAAAVIALVLLLSEAGVVKGRWVRFLVPAALLVWGVRSITHPLPRGSEASAGHEGVQHIWIGIAVTLVGSIELLRATGRLTHQFWGAVLPAGLIVVAALFFFHAQHVAGVPPIVLAVQHRILGATLGVAALTKVLSERAAGFRTAWPVTVLLFGIELMLYTEGVATHQH